MREIDLSQVMVGNGQAITGLAFRKVDGSRLGLTVVSKAFDFKTGNLEGDYIIHVAKNPTT